MSGKLSFLDCAPASLYREDVDLSFAGSAGICIGYCPQQDALDELLTGWEHLQYYCSLRGIPRALVPEVRPLGFSRERIPLRQAWSAPLGPALLS